MRKSFILLISLVFACLSVSAQIDLGKYQEPVSSFDSTDNLTVIMPSSPLIFQVLFVGGEDMVQTTATYGNPAGAFPAKQWHDFIGWTPDETGTSLGWASVNHERIETNDNIGDGGGMTVFRLERDANTDTLRVVSQTLDDGRTGEFFNVDFVNTVGETGMNCGGIVSFVDGRIWTAEEWFRSSNSSIVDRNLGQFVIGEGTIANDSVAAYPVSNTFAAFDGDTLDKFENYNYMVEIDPRQAVAIRKQYNWGKQGFEGGVVMPDNKTVFLGVDATPAFWIKFVADVAGDFTAGDLYAYKHDDPNKWVLLDNSSIDAILSISEQATALGGTMYNRIEWVTMDTVSGVVYMTETGRDAPGSRWADANTNGAVHAPHHLFRAAQQGTHPDSSSSSMAPYYDRYGRVLAYDPVADEITVHISGGPEFNAEVVPSSIYPEHHLSNPDGLSYINIGGQSYLIIQEDLNGNSHGRVPNDITENRTCEMFLLDLSIANPTPADLIFVTSVPLGAEITGAVSTQDGKSILVNSQHPRDTNPYPFNNSLTFAISNIDKVALTKTTSIQDQLAQQVAAFKIFPNPVARTLHFDEPTDAALFTLEGQRVRIVRNSTTMDVTGLAAGTYMVRNLKSNVSRKLVIQ